MLESLAHNGLVMRCRKLGAHYARHAQSLTAQGLHSQALILATAVHRLDQLNPRMSPLQVQVRVHSLMRWLVGQKVFWLAGQLRRRTASENDWLTEAVIAQISGILADLRGTQTGDLPFFVVHGQAFQVFHCRDHRACPLETSLQRWQQVTRQQWYVAVALVLLEASPEAVAHPLLRVVDYTNHIDQPWTRNRTVRWSLDRRQLPDGPPLPSSLPCYPRSSGVGDVLVSVLSGEAWILKSWSGFYAVAAARETET